MDKIYDLVIIGGGPAGYTAAMYAARGGLDTVIVERLAAGGQMGLTDTVDNYPGFDEGIDGFTLGMKMQAGAHRFGARTVYGTVSSVSLSGKVKEINTDTEKLLAYAVIVATGASARHLGISGEDELLGRGVHYCAHCDGMFYCGKHAIVVGGGNSAVSDALFLSRLCKRVTVIHRRDTLRAEKIYRDPLLAAENVSFMWNSKITAINTGEGGRFASVSVDTDNGKCVLEADGLFVSIGREPETALFDELEKDGGYIAAGEDTQSSVPGVFAAGDVRTKPFRQIVTAAADGAVAAAAAEKYLASLKKD